MFAFYIVQFVIMLVGISLIIDAYTESDKDVRYFGYFIGIAILFMDVVLLVASQVTLME